MQLEALNVNGQKKKGSLLEAPFYQRLLILLAARAVATTTAGGISGSARIVAAVTLIGHILLLSIYLGW